MPRSGCHEPTREAERRASGRGAEGERARCGGEEAGMGSGAQRSDGRPTIAFLHCCAMVAEYFKPPPGVGGGRPNRPGVGVGIGIGAERPVIVLEPPPGAGGGRPNRPGVGVGPGPLCTHVCRT